MQANVPTNVAACAAKENGRYDLVHVEYCGTVETSFFAAMDGQAASIVETSGDSGYGLAHKSQFGKERGAVELETHEGRFPRLSGSIPNYNPEKVRVVRLDARRLDAIRRAINGQDGEVTLIIPDDASWYTQPIGVVGEKGIGLITSKDVDANSELQRFQRTADKYIRTVDAARTGVIA